MKIRKSLAGIAAGSLALAGLAVVTAPSASAATGGPYTLTGSPQNQAGTAAYVNTPTVTLTATQSGVNTVITANISIGPRTTSFAGFNANEYRLDAYVRIDGGPQVQLTGQVGTVAVPPSSNSYPSGTTATATVPLSVGAHTIVLQSLVAEGSGSGSGGAFATNFSQVAGFDAIYNLGTTTADIVADPPVAPIALSESITVIPAPTVSISSISGQVAPSAPPFWWAGRQGDVATIAVTNMPGGAPTSAAVCGAGATDITDVTCVAAAISGASVTLPAIATSGPKRLFVSNGVNTPNPYATFVGLGARTVTLTPANGPGGTSTTVNGSNWNPGQAVTIDVVDNSNNVLATAGTTVNGSTAALVPAAITVPALPSGQTSTSIRVTQNGSNVTQAWAYLTSTCDAGQGGSANACSTQQEATATITGGTLSQAATPTGSNTSALAIPFGTAAAAATVVNRPGTFNTVRVTDVRGGTATWSLVASITGGLNEINGTGNIPNSALTFTAVGCTPVGATSAPGTTFTAAGGAFAGATATQSFTLCTKTAGLNASGSTSGQYDVSGSMNLAIPAFTKAGSYSGIIQVTLS